MRLPRFLRWGGSHEAEELPVVQIPPSRVVNAAQLAFLMKGWNAAFDVFSAWYGISPVRVVEVHDRKRVRPGAVALYSEAEGIVYALPGLSVRTAWHEFGHHIHAAEIKVHNLEADHINFDERKSEFVHEVGKTGDYEEKFADTFADEIRKMWW